MKQKCFYKIGNILLIGMFVLTIVVVAIYFYQFHGVLSSDSSDWGNFGDFVGGISTLLFTGVNVIIFYQLTKQMNESNDIHANKQQQINMVMVRSEIQKFLFVRIRELISPIIKGTDAMEESLEQLKILYFYVNWLTIDSTFSHDAEEKRNSICEQIRSILGIDRTGKVIQATKQQDDRAWNQLRNDLILLEMLMNKTMMENINTLDCQDINTLLHNDT